MSVARKLAAIFYADVAGYSRMTGADEVGTHQRVIAALDPAFLKRKGDWHPYPDDARNHQIMDGMRRHGLIGA